MKVINKAMDGDISVAKKMLNSLNVNSVQQDKNGSSILHDTVIFDAKDYMPLLLESNKNEIKKLLLKNSAKTNFLTNRDKKKKETKYLCVDNEKNNEFFYKNLFIRKHNTYEKIRKWNQNESADEFVKIFKDDINDTFRYGKTPLLLACENGHVDLVKSLIKHGADIDVEDIYGEGAWEYASRSKNSDEVIALLNDAENIKKPKYNPKRLVELLSSFTRDTPVKYTTHLWDFGELEEVHGGFDGFMRKVDGYWNGKIADELKELSPNLFKKIEKFLKSWSEKDGLKVWCDSGNDPFDFILDGKKFGEDINRFKQEIEIRKESNILENIFLDIEEGFDSEHEIEMIKLKGKQFYTDTAKFKVVLKKIFSEIEKREPKQIIVEATDPKGEYIDISITHIGSFASQDGDSMLGEAEDGDFADIKNSLKNLCDWSIENHYEDKSYRVNYLSSDVSLNAIESIEQKPKGFTHKLRFYT